MAYKVTKKRLMEVVLQCNGTYVDVQRRLGMKSPVTAKKWVHKYKDVLELFWEVQRNTIDLAEDVIMCNLQSSNEYVSQKAAEFLLKNLPESRFRDSGEDAQVEMVKLLDKLMTNAEK